MMQASLRDSELKVAPVCADPKPIDAQAKYGRLKFNDGRVFKGQHVQGHILHGKMTYQDGCVYEGSWLHGKRHGTGRCMFVDGSVYEGEFSEGNIHGNGKMAWIDGGYYIGEWSRGEMNGRGTEIRSDGSLRHDGVWQQGVPIRYLTPWREISEDNSRIKVS